MSKTIIACLLAFPLVTSAVWWNPVTWFDQEAAVVQYQSPTPPEPQVVVEEKIVEVPVEKVVEKVVEKTIKVDNPELLAQITSLKAQLTEAKAKQCPVSPSPAPVVPTSAPTVGKACKVYQDGYDLALRELQAVKDKYQADMAHYAQFVQTEAIKKMIEEYSDSYNLDLAVANKAIAEAKVKVNEQCR